MNIINKYSNIIYDEEDTSLATMLSDYLNLNAEKIYNFFDPDLERKSVDINLMTKKEYDVLHNDVYHGDVPKWSVGFYDGKSINYVSLNDYKNTSHNIDNYEEALSYYLKTIVHEYVHFVTSLYCIKNNLDQPIKYISEGIAQVLSGQRDNDVIKFDYTEKDILDENNKYGAWYLVTKYILDEKGKDCFFELLGDRNKAKEFVFDEINNIDKYYSNNKTK